MLEQTQSHINMANLQDFPAMEQKFLCASDEACKHFILMEQIGFFARAFHLAEHIIHIQSHIFTCHQMGSILHFQLQIMS